VTVEYLDLTDFLTIAEEVLGIRAEDIGKAPASTSQSRRFTHLAPASCA
jgi:hypothetical protein